MSLVQLAHMCSHLQNASTARLGLTSVPFTKLHLNVALALQKQGFFSTVDLGGPSPPLVRYAAGTQKPRAAVRPSETSQSKETALYQIITQRQRIERQDTRYENPAYTQTRIAEQMNGVVEELRQKGYLEEDLEWAKARAHLTWEQVREEGVAVEAMGLTIENQPLVEDVQTIDPRDGIITRENRASRRLWLGLKYWQGEPVLQRMKQISKPTKRIWLSNADFVRIVRGSQAGEVKGLGRLGEVMIVSTDRGIMDARECVERRVGGQPLLRAW